MLDYPEGKNWVPGFSDMPTFHVSDTSAACSAAFVTQTMNETDEGRKAVERFVSFCVGTDY